MVPRLVLALSIGLRLLLLVGLFAAPSLHQAFAGDIASSVDASALPKKKQTPAGLYLTPKDAHEALEQDPSIVFIDVRDPIEVSFIGHAASMDANIPLATATHKFDPNKGAYQMQPNKAFLAQVKAAIAAADGGKDTPVFLMCRSGARSAVAARILLKAGYTNVWNIVEGFEGDKDKKTGTRSVNGWRNAELPWEYKIPATKAWSAEAEAPKSE